MTLVRVCIAAGIPTMCSIGNGGAWVKAELLIIEKVVDDVPSALEVDVVADVAADGVLDRDDVLATGSIDVVERRRERRRLPRAGRAGDEDEPTLLVGKSCDTGRKVEVGKPAI